MEIESFAPAKVNLTLHVTGRREDGYHLLDSLVVFADVGDRIFVAESDALSLTVRGPRADDVPSDDSNLVLKAARLFGQARGARITLDKRLPVASGVGGGSSDAAAAVRALSKLWRSELPDRRSLLALGADIPVCMEARPCRMSGIGETIAPVGRLPPFWLVLANPGVAVSTPAVFTALDTRDGSPMPAALPRFSGFAGFADWLVTMRNDLEPPAQRIAPQITLALAGLAAQPGCRLARMSGSGATCFGLFERESEARSAANALRKVHPGWWVESAGTFAQP